MNANERVGRRRSTSIGGAGADDPRQAASRGVVFRTLVCTEAGEALR